METYDGPAWRLMSTCCVGALHRLSLLFTRRLFITVVPCVFITAVPITKLFTKGGGGEVEDMCYERLRAEAYVN